MQPQKVKHFFIFFTKKKADIFSPGFWLFAAGECGILEQKEGI